MEVKTKFNVGATIYTVEDCAIKELTVSCIAVFIYKDKTNITYQCNGLTSVNEENAFQSREALLYNLQNS